MNFTEPTPIQKSAIPVALTGRDILGCAQTGGGKTAAFALPILHRLLERGRSGPASGPRALVLVPTRELAAQVETAFRSCGRFTPFKLVVVIGGVSYGPQTKAVSQGAEIVIATPGRLLDHLKQGNFRLDAVEELVLDEADRMLDMGFLPDIRAILGRIPRERRTQLYSATLHSQIEQVAAFAMRNPHRVEIERPSSVAEGISQVVYPVIQSQKGELMLTLLKNTEMRSVLVFTRTKHGADRLARRLAQHNYSVGTLHSNRSQNQRTTAMDSFRAGRIQILVATDIAARGIDVRHISHVINFDVPRFPEDYVHRVGRTARAYGVGDAITLMDPAEASYVKDIEKFTGVVFPRAVVPNFQYNNAPQAPHNPPSHRPSHPGRHQPRQGSHPQKAPADKPAPRNDGFLYSGGYGFARTAPRRDRFRRRFGRH